MIFLHEAYCEKDSNTLGFNDVIEVDEGSSALEELKQENIS